MPEIIKRNTALHASAICLMIFGAAFFGILQYLTPYQWDDLYYGGPWKNAMTCSGAGASFAEILEFIRKHWLYANGRLGDKLVVIVLTDFPKWLTGTVTGLCSFCIFLYGSKLAFGSLLRWPMRSVVLTALLTIFLPWGSYMMVTCMTINYVWGAALAVIILYLFVRQPELPVPRRLRVSLLFLLSMVASAWHEGYSVPILGGMVVFLLVMRGDNTWVRRVLMLGTFAGILIVVSAPGFWVRYDSDLGFMRPSAYILPAIVKGLNIALLAPVLLGVALSVPRLRCRLSRLCIAALAMSTVSVLLSIAIFLKSIFVMRVFWYVDIFAISALAMSLSEMTAQSRGRFWTVGAQLITVFLIAHWCVTLAWQFRITSEYNDIIEAYAKSDDGLVYYDFHGQGFGPAIALRRARIFGLSTDMRCYEIYMTSFYREDGVPLSLVPTGLKDFDMRRFPRGRRVALIEGHFVMRGDTVFDRLDGYYPTYVTDRGEQMSIRTLVNPFQAADGTRLYYLEPEERHVGNARLVDIIP